MSQFLLNGCYKISPLSGAEFEYRVSFLDIVTKKYRLSPGRAPACYCADMLVALLPWTKLFWNAWCCLCILYDLLRACIP